MRGVSLIGWLALLGCGSRTPMILEAQIPAEARSLLVALEQGEHHVVSALDATSTPVELQLPESISDDAPARLTLVSIDRSLERLGLERAGPLSPAAGATQPLSSLPPLRAETTTIFEQEAAPTLTESTLDPWLAEFPIARVARCPSIEFEFAVGTSPVIAAVSVRPDLALGLSIYELTLLRPGGQHTEIPLPRGEVGQGIGLSREGVVWVVTSSRAAVVDPETGRFLRSIPLPEPGLYRGVFDDELAGRLYLVSGDAHIWELEHGAPSWNRSYAVPSEFIRHEEVDKVPVHIFAHANPGRFLVAMREVAAIVDFSRERQSLFTGARTGSGFVALRDLQTGGLLASEHFSGDVYTFDGDTWQPAGEGRAQIVDIAPLEPRRFLYLTRWAISGVLDLDDPFSCPEVQAIEWPEGRAIVRTDDDYWVGLETNFSERGWARMHVRFED